MKANDEISAPDIAECADNVEKQAGGSIDQLDLVVSVLSHLEIKDLYPADLTFLGDAFYEMAETAELGDSSEPIAFLGDLRNILGRKYRAAVGR